MNTKQLEELFDLVQYLNVVYLIYKRRKMAINSNKRRWWVRPLNLDRDIAGYFNTTFLPMKIMDLEEFFIQTRMPRAVYDRLLNLVQENLTKNSIRPAISYECRLAITLW